MQTQPATSFQTATLILKIFFGKNSDMDSNTTYECNFHPTRQWDYHFSSSLVGLAPGFLGKTIITLLYLHIDLKA